jgi:hypothetical protein
MSLFKFLAKIFNPFPVEDNPIPTLKVDIRYVRHDETGYLQACPFFDDEQWSFDYLGSERATRTSYETHAGIFSQFDSVVVFWRGETKVMVDFGNRWLADCMNNYDDPVAEIYRRIAIVEQAFKTHDDERNRCS